MPNPIQHVVIIVKENHCFDNYFGTFPGAEGISMPHSPNPPPRDPDHRHAAWLTRKTTAARQQFVESDVPAYFAYARQFTLCDHYFTDVAGPSSPNHLMLIAAASPIINNPPSGTTPRFSLPSLPSALETAHLSWGDYGGYIFDFIQDIQGINKFPSAQFQQDAQAGKLPTVSWVYAPHDASEHPPDPQDRGNPLVGNVTHGMQWTVDQVNAVVKGGLWPKTAIFITWDDWGGWFDHVDPPELEKWTDGTQFRCGSRVPCLVLSPYAKRGYVSKNLHSHVSLLKFCTLTFGLPTWNQRLAAADDMGDCFDFQQQPGGPPVLKTKTSKKSSGEQMVRQSAAEKSYPSHGDSVKIVPLHVPDAVKAPVEQAQAVPPPQLTYRNGPLITGPEVFLLFWGAGWQQSPQSDLVQRINQFFDFILTSGLLDQLAEYSVPGQQIGHGTRTGSVTVTSPALKHSVQDSAIQQFVQQEISNNSAVPKPGPNTLYFVFLPPGVKVIQGGSASCQSFCGYHNDIGGQTFYAVMPYPGCQGCVGGLAVFDALTTTSSHELCEAVTDPIPGQGWYDDNHGEIGDICAWKTKTVGNYTVQLEWSNKANNCV